jgi:DNA processing protein
MEKLAKENVSVITIKDEKYPKLLREIYNPPALLYYKGRLEEDEFAIAVVGTRKCTSYGKQVTSEITRDLANNGITIVSGLALGIDTLAHQAALEVNEKTIAVLGSGLDAQNIYPVTNCHLAEKIIETGGTLISEHPLGTLPLKFNFPQRNRIIAGLTLGTLVVEAPLTSGALITAKFALEFNREVFAVPGSIYSENSAGPNNLIKMGAKAVASAADILEALNLQRAIEYVEAKKIVPDSKNEAILLEYLSKEPVHIDILIKQSKLDTATVNSTITMMEIKGKVRNLGGSQYVLAR